jgi:hypothetical protein
LNGVAALSNSEIWAVGSDTQPGQVTLAEHSTGAAFARAGSPSPGSSSTLNAVAEAGQGQYWAVGQQVVHGSQTNTLVVRRCD